MGLTGDGLEFMIRPSGVINRGKARCSRGSWTLSGRGPRQMTRDGSIGVRWYVGEGGIMGPPGEIGEMLGEFERSKDGIRVRREWRECGEIGERGDVLGPELFPGKCGDGNGGATVIGDGRSKCRFVQSPGCGVIGDGREFGREFVLAYEGEDAGDGSSDGRWCGTGLTSWPVFSVMGDVGDADVYTGEGPCNCLSSFLRANSYGLRPCELSVPNSVASSVPS